MIRSLVRPIPGQAAIEFAIVLLLILLLTVCVIDAGRAMLEYNTVAFLARDAARYGTIPTRSSSDIETYARHRCSSMQSNPCPDAPMFDVSVPSRGTCGSTTDPLIVTVSMQFHPVIPTIEKFWILVRPLGPLTLQASTQMYVEQAPPGGCAT